MAAFPGANGRIAYVFSEDQPIDDQSFAVRGDIVTVLPDGSGLQELTDGPADEREPSWSADGRSLVFSRALGTSDYAPSNYQLFTMSADGSGQTRITNSSDNAHSPSFAPDGRRVVYTRDNFPAATPPSIWTIRTDGTDPRQLLATDGFVSSPQYSPNGRRIIFSEQSAGKNRDGIWTMRRDGSDLHRLAKPAEHEIDLDPDYSPDGRHIVFRRVDDFDYYGPLHLMRADGSRERPIPGTPGYASPAHAPAGDRIAVAYGPFDDFPCLDTFTISLAGSDRQGVTHNCDPQGTHSFPRFAGSPSWQPLPGPLSNDFSFGKVKRNKRKGTAKMPVNVPGPGELDLAKTKKVKPQAKRAPGAGEVKLAIKPKGESRRALRKRGKAKVLAKVTYTPDGGDANTESKRLKLIDK